MHSLSLLRNAVVFTLIALLVPVAAQAQAPGPVTIKVMTRNMDAGTDLTLVVGATDAASFAAGMDATLKAVKDSGIPERATRLAREIAAQKPDLIGLQEVTLWRTGPLSMEPLGAADVLYDQLDLLMTELKNLKLRYTVVVVQNLIDVEVPVPTQNLNVRMTDRDVILVRGDLKPSELDISNIQTRRYAALLTLPVLGGLTILRSWEAADVTLRGATFRFVNTHLETTIPGVPDTVLLQLAQTQELLRALPSDVPVVLLGDFNANAEPGPEHTGSVEMITGAGLTDVWKAVQPYDPGFTWPMFPEDGARFVQANERIDLIFSRGATPVSAQRVGSGGPWGGGFAADHAGVVATLRLGK